MSSVSVSLGIIISVAAKSSCGIAVLAGAGLRIVLTPFSLAILKAVTVLSSALSN